MAGKGYINHGKHIFDDMQAAIDSVHKRLDMFIGASKQPTMPTYPFATANPGDLPDDPVQGQVAISGDDDTLWFYSNGAWHEVSKDLPWAVLAVQDYAISSGAGNFTTPFQESGFYTSDDSFYEFDDGSTNGGFPGIKIKGFGFVIVNIGSVVVATGNHEGAGQRQGASLITSGAIGEVDLINMFQGYSEGAYDGVGTTWEVAEFAMLNRHTSFHTDVTSAARLNKNAFSQSADTQMLVYKLGTGLPVSNFVYPIGP